MESLDAAGRSYRIACTVQGVNGVWRQSRRVRNRDHGAVAVPPDLIELPTSAGMPDAGEIDFVLLTNPRSVAPTAAALAAAILGTRAAA